MKNVILAVSIFLALPTHSHAQAVAFDYTGNNAQIGESSNFSWTPLTFREQLGGAADVTGLAQQFTLDSITNIGSINSQINAV